MTHGPTHIQSNIDQSCTSKIYNVHVTNSEALVHRARGSREITHAAHELREEEDISRQSGRH